MNDWIKYFNKLTTQLSEQLTQKTR